MDVHLTRRRFLQIGAATGVGLMLPLPAARERALASAQLLQTPLPPGSIPQFVDPLPNFANARIPAGSALTLTAENSVQQVLPAALYPLGVLGTKVWAYKIIDGDGGVHGPLYPVYTLEAQRNQQTTMTFVNNVTDNYLYQLLTVDQTLHWADPGGLGHPPMGTVCPVPPPGTAAPDWCQFYTGPVPLVPHLHGGEVPSDSDGGPDGWMTPGNAQKGPAWLQGAGDIFTYPNQQEAATVWYHDHALGVTRLNVYAGLAGFYFIRDDWDTGAAGTGANFPAGNYEIEMAIQDRSFDVNGQWMIPDAGINPEHPYWVPEFVGDVIVVNGKTWPFLNVEPRRYRFRIVNGSNARTYELALSDNKTKNPGPPLYQIGTDGGLMDKAVKIDPAIKGLNKLTLMPGERADIIVDFSGYGPGTNPANGLTYSGTLSFKNTAKTPYPAGAMPQGSTLGKVMQFRVNQPLVGTDSSYNPAVTPSPRKPGRPMVKLANGTGALAAGVAPDKNRQLTLNEVMGMPMAPWVGGPLEILLNNTKWDGEMSPNISVTDFPDGVTETPQCGSTEVWDIVNVTADAHPIHLHLVQFQLVSRQNFDVPKYMAVYNMAFPGGGKDHMTGQAYPPNVYIPAFGPPLDYRTGAGGGVLGGNPSVTPFLKGPKQVPQPNEVGWKDTVQMFPGQVTRIVARWAPTDLAAGSTVAGTEYYPFDSTAGPGYVWHCHIIDHEDNEMMRPQKVKP